jgi:UDP-N-acetylglucosamine--N-acetylmuramyl-(pentapeptide) pyrophosphoryl-undecaprenol N-acetylglucosamine transferase
MKVIISGGGTGGHIYPAIAIANQLKASAPTTQILFVGAEGKMEMEKVPKAGYQIIGLPIVGIQRSLSLSNLLFPFKLVRSLLKARTIIKDFEPDVAIGVGGFASGPLLMVASMMGVPTIIQEQNSHAGITNKLLAKRAKKICVAYPNMEIFFPINKIKLTGNPVRSDILDISNKKTTAYSHFGLNPNKKTLLVIGGSLGAKTINESIEAGLDKIIEAGYQILWQTGKPYIDKAKTAVEALKTGAVVASDFIYEMDLAYAAADVVVSRAGALSVSELCLVGKPAILVPFPFAAEDHQTQNALSLVNHDAAILIKDQDAKNELITATLNLFENTEKQKQLSKNIQTLAKPNAAQEIVGEILAIGQSSLVIGKIPMTTDTMTND